MERTPINIARLLAISRRFAGRLLTVGENRLQLLLVEVQEERERLLHSVLLAFGVAAFSLLAALTLTGAIVVLLWELSPVAALLALASLYGATAVCLYRRLTRLLRDWQSLPATLDQLRWE